ncbi:hypothetical protein [Mesorhizobium sp. M0767]|uniref:hypothetical protein n=1 Tax=Mesorhizobium sp. M0767 TaxID=2956995 RepID=UPI00333C02F2
MLRSAGWSGRKLSPSSHILLPAAPFDTLIPSGAGRHWIERYRGDIFVFVSDAADEAILRREFSGLLDAVDDTETGRTGRR